MGNSIYLKQSADHSSEYVGMSNGLTSVFIDVIVLSGSVLASTNREKEFIIWLAQRDQSVVGIGTVGFSLDELPWCPEQFISNQQFLIRTIHGALARTGWEKLNYEPTEEIIVNSLRKFERLVAAFRLEDIDTQHYEEWSEIEEGDDRPTIPPGYPRCLKHDIYLSCHGCVICNYNKS